VAHRINPTASGRCTTRDSVKSIFDLEINHTRQITCCKTSTGCGNQRWFWCVCKAILLHTAVLSGKHSNSGVCVLQCPTRSARGTPWKSWQKLSDCSMMTQPARFRQVPHSFQTLFRCTDIAAQVCRKTHVASIPASFHRWVQCVEFHFKLWLPFR
jgi:hypothetical protein